MQQTHTVGQWSENSPDMQLADRLESTMLYSASEAAQHMCSFFVAMFYQFQHFPYHVYSSML